MTTKLIEYYVCHRGSEDEHTLAIGEIPTTVFDQLNGETILANLPRRLRRTLQKSLVKQLLDKNWSQMRILRVVGVDTKSVRAWTKKYGWGKNVDLNT